jgi:hypothetical protein
MERFDRLSNYRDEISSNAQADDWRYFRGRRPGRRVLALFGSLIYLKVFNPEQAITNQGE